MGVVAQPLLDGIDRLVLLINQTTIRGKTRLQKYGFLAYHLYRPDLMPFDFYSDWEACHYGPYSMDLTCDLQHAEKTGLVKTELAESGSGKVVIYSLGPKGHQRLSLLSRDHRSLINNIHETSINLNKKPLPVLVEEIYVDHPEYAVNRKVKNRATNGEQDDGVRFNPEIERMLEEIDSGKANWKTQTPDEHLEYLESLLKD